MPWSVVVMVVMIVLITALSKVSKAKYEAMGRQREWDGKSADTALAEHEVRQLKERIAVLERVVTENHGSHDLDRQIERLRDR